MTVKMVQAVILAAGMGSRIRSIHTLPKGFIQLGEKSIIQESIDILHDNGIEQIAIITGYSSAHYEKLAQLDSTLTTIFNPHYHCFGSLYSLYCARNWVTSDFLILESDIIYEPRAIKKILAHPKKNVILLSGQTHSGDEVYVQTHHEKLTSMSKQKEKLTHIDGEFVGISKLSCVDFQLGMHALSAQMSILENGHYDEQGFVTMSAQYDIHCLKIPDLKWCEIDNDFHLQRAKKLYGELKWKVEA